MSKQLGCALLALTLTAAQSVDPPESLSFPKGTQRTRLAGVAPVQDDDAPPQLPLAELRRYLQKLKSEREALDEDRAKSALLFNDARPSDGDDAGKLRLRLGELLTTLGTQKTTAPPRLAAQLPAPKKKDAATMTLPVLPKSTDPPSTGTHQEPIAPKSETGFTADPLALAQNRFLAGDYQGALAAFRQLPLEGLKSEERAPVQYMIASCLRKLGKFDDAALLYRDVANLRGDEHLAACAQWQLSMLRWRREANEQLTRIRLRRLELEKQP